MNMIAKRKILVVDDDEDTLELITMMIESAGYEVIGVDSGEACLQMLRKIRPDLIIMDVMMETMTKGFNVGYDIKHDPHYRSIPLIIVSAIDKQAGFPVDINSIEADSFMEKPLEPERLLKSIKELMK